MELFNHLYKEHSDAIFKYIMLLVGNKETEEDLTQETFYRAFKNRASFRREARERTWLRKIARNLVIDYFRRKRLINWLPFVEKEEIRDTLPVPEELIIKGQQQVEIYQQLLRLKLEYREAIVLRIIEELSVKECAQILSWSEVKVKNNTQRGMRALRRMLEEGVMTDGKATRKTTKRSR